MALNLAQKQAIVAEVAEIAQQSISAVIADYRGLTVAQMTTLRSDARKTGVYVRIVRNTLAKKAIKGTSFECLEETLIGPSILAFSREEPSAAAKLLRDFAKENEALSIRALSLGGKKYEAWQTDVIALLPTKPEAIARLLSVFQAPITKLVRTLAAVPTKVVRTVVAIKDQKQAEG